MSSIVQEINQLLISKKEVPSFNTGDNVSIHYKIIEGNKERIQIFRGDVIYMKGQGLNRKFCVRKLSNGVGVERIFPMNSPYIDKIEVNRRGKVRRARIFYLREQIGKAARIKELRKR